MSGWTVLLLFGEILIPQSFPYSLVVLRVFVILGVGDKDGHEGIVCLVHDGRTEEVTEDGFPPWGR